MEGEYWKIILENLTGNILFIDEENHFIKTKEFAEAVQKSDNYFVIITRKNLYNLPYSVEKIYGMHASGKYRNTKRVYQELYQIYPANTELPEKPDKIIVEDSNSAYEFFQFVANENDIECESAGGKTRLFAMLKKNSTEKICVIADGAAIRPEMDSLYKLVIRNNNIKLYLPESFEWLVLNSGLLDNKEIKQILNTPENYIESQEYFG